MIPFAIGVALLAFGVPVAVVIGLVAVVALYLSDTSLILVGQQLFHGMDTFVLLAIPFYMLTGAIMEASGIADRLIKVAKAMVGFLPGGLGMVDVVASMFFADISGSATADTAAVGSVMIPGLVRAGYRPTFAAALQSASGSLGLLLPPSISQIVYAYVAQVSTGQLFAAALIPGVLVAISFMIVNLVYALREKLPRDQRFSLSLLIAALREAIWALLTPVIILGGIFSGICTPTEAGVIAVIYTLLIATLVYRSLSWRQIPELLEKTVFNSARVLFLLGSAMVLGMYLTREQVPQMVAEYLHQVVNNKLLLLLLINLALFVVHMALETIASIFVVVPVLMPLLAQAHIDPIHFGVILMVNSAIGINFPPIGFCLYIASSVAGVRLEEAARAIVPFLFALVVDLILVSALPGLSLTLPSLFH
jgi:tripartite ATP-independent transporter DctM subunit